MLELHEAGHKGAACKAVGSVQPPDPGPQHVPQELEALAVHALLDVRAEEGHELLAGGRGDAETLRHGRRARAVQALSNLHARGGQVVVHLGESRSPRGAGSSPPWRRTPSPARRRGTSRAASSALRRRAGRSSRRAVGHGQRHCGWVPGVEVQVGDPADGLLGPVVFASSGLLA